jgi:hypothetical protein
VQPPTEQEDAAWAEIQATPDDPGVEEVPPAQPSTHATIKLGGNETIQVMTRGRCFRYLSRTPGQGLQRKRAFFFYSPPTEAAPCGK